MKKFASILAVLVLAFALVGCAASTPKASVKNCPVLEDTEFGGVFLDMTIDEFNDAGFTFGDAVDVSFSNGYELKNIPYYSGYFVRMGQPLVLGYPGYPHVKVCLNYAKLWEEAGVAEGDTATITLAEAGKFASVQNALGVAYTNNRADYATDEVFANFRELSGGRIVPGAAYRSASPVDNEYARVPYVEKLMAETSVGYVLNLSDSAEEVDAFMAEDEAAGIDMTCFRALREKGNVSYLNLSANFMAPEYETALAAGLADMAEHDGPYLVHCVEGKDRTGFVCIVLEALSGASYEELQADYMLTYENYYGISKQADPERYQAVSDLLFDELMAHLAGVGEDADLSAIDYEQAARDYLLAAGMSEHQIDRLAARLTA